MNVTAMPQGCSWRELPLIDGLDEAAGSYPETRIGAFDFSEATRTDVLGHASGSVHRASIASCREVVADLGFYTQPDPATFAWSVFPDAFGYASLNPGRFVDRIGLYTIDGSCLSRESFAAPIRAGVSDVCAKTRPGTSCHEALKNVSAAVGGKTDIPGCFAGYCGGTRPMEIWCHPCLKVGGEFPCAATSGIANRMIISGTGNSGCPLQRGLGFGGTIFHESLHNCVFGGTDPHQPGREASWFRYLEKACFNWRDPQAPPIGPPM